MKLNFSTSSLVFLLFISINILSSCRDQNYDWNAAKKDQRVEQYEESFKSIFGDIDPQQSWDFSTCIIETRGIDSSNEDVSRAAASNSIRNATNADAVASLPNSPASFFKNNANFNENKINTASYGTVDAPVYAPEGKFCICPVWHGDMEIEGLNLIIKWEKSTFDNNKFDVVKNSGEITLSFTQIMERMNTSESWNSIVKNSQPEPWIGDFEKGTSLTFCLEKNGYRGSSLLVKTDCSEFYASADKGKENVFHSRYTTLMMLDAPGVSSNTGNGDYNDLHLMFTSVSDKPTDNNVPSVATGVDTETQVLSKRYMVEDLGSSANSDIDFNDIVLDFSKTIVVKKPYKYVVGEESNKRYLTDAFSYEESVDVIIKALGGTMDFQLALTSGSVSTIFFQKSLSGFSGYNWNLRPGLSSISKKTMYNTGSAEDGFAHNYGSIDYTDAGYVCKLIGANLDWNPSDNNIQIIMVDEKSTGASNGTSSGADIDSGDKYVIAFPSMGSVPAILAFDTKKNWRLERDGITKEEIGSTSGKYNWFSNDNY